MVALLQGQVTNIQIQPALSEGQEWMKFKNCEGRSTLGMSGEELMAALV